MELKVHVSLRKTAVKGEFISAIKKIVRGFLI